MDIKAQSISLKAILVIIALGIWALVLQNAGIIYKEKNVYVSGGSIDNINSTVDVKVDNTVDVNVYNTVDVNIEAINGHRDVFFNNPRRGDRNKYYVLPVTVE